MQLRCHQASETLLGDLESNCRSKAKLADICRVSSTCLRSTLWLSAYKAHPFSSTLPPASYVLHAPFNTWMNCNTSIMFLILCWKQSWYQLTCGLLSPGIASMLMFWLDNWRTMFRSTHMCSESENCFCVDVLTEKQSSHAEDEACCTWCAIQTESDQPCRRKGNCKAAFELGINKSIKAEITADDSSSNSSNSDCDMDVSVHAPMSDEPSWRFLALIWRSQISLASLLWRFCCDCSFTWTVKDQYVLMCFEALSKCLCRFLPTSESDFRFSVFVHCSSLFLLFQCFLR